MECPKCGKYGLAVFESYNGDKKEWLLIEQCGNGHKFGKRQKASLSDINRYGKANIRHKI